MAQSWHIDQLLWGYNGDPILLSNRTELAYSHQRFSLLKKKKNKWPRENNEVYTLPE